MIAAFGRTINSIPRARRDSKIRRRVYERSARLEVRDAGPCDVEESFDVCVEHPVPIRVGHVDFLLQDAIYTGPVEDVINASIL